MQINIHFHSTTVPVGYRQFFGDVCPPAASAGGGGGGQLGLKASERERGRTSGFSLATATETYRTRFQKKNQGEDGDSLRKSYLFPNVFVTNLQFNQVRFFFNVTEVSIFLLIRRHTTVN